MWESEFRSLVINLANKFCGEIVNWGAVEVGEDLMIPFENAHTEIEFFVDIEFGSDSFQAEAAVRALGYGFGIRDEPGRLRITALEKDPVKYE